MKNPPFRTLLLALLPWITGICWAQEPTLDVLRIAYSDDAGRTIDYDFTSGTMDEDGWIAIPARSVLGRAEGERDAVYEWGDAFGFNDAILDTAPPGTYSVPAAEDDFGYLYANLAGDGDGPSSGNWTWETEVRGSRTVDIGVEDEAFLPVASFHAGLQDFDEEGVPGALFLFAALHNPETGGFLWSHTESVELNGAHELADPLGLRMSFTREGTVMRTEYRLGGGNWELFSKHALEGTTDPLTGLFDTSPYVSLYDGGDFVFSPSLVVANPEWDIIVSSFGYSDIVSDRTSGFEGREYLSGEWGSAVAYTLSESGRVAPTWLEPNFLFPDWTTNSDFEEVTTIEHTSDDQSSAESTIANEHLEITQTFEMVDTVFGLPLGLAPADASGDGDSVRSSRHALRHTYSIENISGETITDLNLFKLLHGLQSTVSVYDDRPYSGPFEDYRHTTTQVGVDVAFTFDGGDFDSDQESTEFEDYIAFLSPVAPVAFENGHFGTEAEDSHTTGKPSVGTHISIEENALDNTARFEPEELWVAGAQQWDLGALEPGETVEFDVLLTVSTGTRTSAETPAGRANGGASVAGGMDFWLENVTSSGTVFARHLASDTEETDEWVSRGELPEVGFDTGGDRLQAWNVSSTAGFSGIAGLTFGYDEQPLREGLVESRLAVFHWNGSEWEELESLANPWTDRVSAASDDFSWFALGLGEAADNRFYSDDFAARTQNPVLWHKSGGTTGVSLEAWTDRVQLVADQAEPGYAVRRSRSVFRLDEDFRARVDFDASHFSTSSIGGLALAVIRDTGQPDGAFPDDYLLIENGSRDWYSLGNDPKWIAAHVAEDAVTAFSHDDSTRAREGTFFIEYGDGVFHLGRDGYGEPNAFASFAPEGWDETDLVSIALLGIADGVDVTPRDPASFKNFAIERRPAATFNDWTAAVATSDPDAPDASAAGDETPNLLRYALGAGPYEPVSGHLPTVALDPQDGPGLHFRRNANATDLVLEIDASENLVDWSVIARSEAGAPFQSSGYFPHLIEEQDIDGSLKATTLTPADPEKVPLRTFYRLRVEPAGN